MSWDFHMEIDAGGEEPVIIHDDLNYTYNVSTMYYAAMGGDGIRGLNGFLGQDALVVLKPALKRMKCSPKEYQKFNPENGWGCYDGAIKVLATLINWCESAPKAVLIVS